MEAPSDTGSLTGEGEKATCVPQDLSPDETGREGGWNLSVLKGREEILKNGDKKDLSMTFIARMNTGIVLFAFFGLSALETTSSRSLWKGGRWENGPAGLGEGRCMGEARNDRSLAL
jgi:hypothetical protein